MLVATAAPPHKHVALLCHALICYAVLCTYATLCSFCRWWHRVSCSACHLCRPLAGRCAGCLHVLHSTPPAVCPCCCWLLAGLCCCRVHGGTQPDTAGAAACHVGRVSQVRGVSVMSEGHVLSLLPGWGCEIRPAAGAMYMLLVGARSGCVQCSG